MEEFLIVKNMLSAAAFGVAFVAERRRNRATTRGPQGAEGAARRLPAAWRHMADAVPVPLILADASGAVIFVNAACEDLTGVRGEDLVGRGAWECLAALGADEHATAVVRRAVEEGAPAICGARHCLPGGRELTVQWELSPLGPNVPDAPALVICGLDLTECLALQRELARTERLCAVGQLTAGIAHELNNALTAVTGLAELAHGAGAGEEGRAHLERLLAQAQRCRRIADSLLGFVREPNPRREPVCVSELVADTVALVRCRFDLDGLALTTTPAPDLPPVMGDAAELQQVLTNLLINAQQALEEAGGGAVEIAARHDGQGVEIVVRDNGPGIAPAILDRLFDPFVTTKPEGHGTGLGLSISREIAQGHGGSLTASNRPEGGAEFRLRLPAMSAPTARGGDAGADAPAAAGRGRVLLIDDEEPVRLVMREALRGAGHETDETGDAPAALELIGARDYDIIICDLHMPGMSGEEFCDRARETRPELADRIIVTTGDGSTPQARGFLEQSGLRCIQKPFSARELVALVNARIGASGD